MPGRHCGNLTKRRAKKKRYVAAVLSRDVEGTKLGRAVGEKRKRTGKEILEHLCNVQCWSRSKHFRPLVAPVNAASGPVRLGSAYPDLLLVLLYTSTCQYVPQVPNLALNQWHVLRGKLYDKILDSYFCSDGVARIVVTVTTCWRLPYLSIRTTINICQSMQSYCLA